MKPPICAVCDERFFENGGLVYFKETEDDKKNNDRMRNTEMVGHPTNAFWFCEDHYEFSSNLKELTKIEAFKIIKKEFSEDKC